MPPHVCVRIVVVLIRTQTIPLWEVSNLQMFFFSIHTTFALTTEGAGEREKKTENIFWRGGGVGQGGGGGEDGASVS